LFVSLQAESRRGRDNSVHCAQFLRNKSGDFPEITALYHDGEIVSAAHQPTIFNLVETRDPFSEPIEAASSFRSDADFDECRYRVSIDFFGIDHGLIGQNNPLLLVLIDPTVDLFDLEI
jgi:hypothetical protein